MKKSTFNNAVSSGELSAPVILGRDHHDVKWYRFSIQRNIKYL